MAPLPLYRHPPPLPHSLSHSKSRFDFESVFRGALRGISLARIHLAGIHRSHTHKFPVRIEEEDIQGDEGILHPEVERSLFRKDEEHPPIVPEFRSSHESLGMFGGVIGDFDPERERARTGAESYPLQACVIFHAGGEEEGEESEEEARHESIVDNVGTVGKVGTYLTYLISFPTLPLS